MKFLGVISGGKDSIFNMQLAIEDGNTPVCLLNMKMTEEKDSYMFQYAGSNLILGIGECLNLPVHQFNTTGLSTNLSMEYEVTEDDEIEDLFLAIKSLKEKYSFEGVSVGAISSTYQYNRVSNICTRLNLSILGYLWNSNQYNLLDRMIDSKIDAIVVKGGGFLSSLVGSRITEVREKYSKYIEEQIEEHKNLTKEDFNICGEGGEYETITLDSAIYNRRIEIVRSRIVDDGTGVKSLEIEEYRVVDK